MLRRDASSIFRSVLLLSAVGTACGGAVESGSNSEGQPRSDGSTSSSSSGGSSSGGSSSGGSTSSSGGSSSTSSSSGGSTSSSGGSTSSGSSSGYASCVNGSMPTSDAYCCPAGQTCPYAGGGDDAADGGPACTLDCDAVCSAVAPDVFGGFRSCWRTSDGQIAYTCGACGVGRVPSDTKACPPGETIGQRLARQAYYEAASVVAFERLARVLEDADAPPSLVSRVRAAAEDEARHAAIFRALASAHGAAVPAVEVAGGPPSLFDLAVENATEGCVRETFGAVVTLHQASYAASEAIRAAYAEICDDEAEHAALSWELRAWFDEQLDAEQRAEVDRAHRAALEAARFEAEEIPDAPGVALGLPAPARARRMLDLAIDAMGVAA